MCVPLAMGGSMVESTVADHGAGLTVDKLEKIFEPIYTTKSDGLGLGLSINRSIIEAHGGTCGQKTTWIEARPFTLRCPQKVRLGKWLR